METPAGMLPACMPVLALLGPPSHVRDSSVWPGSGWPNRVFHASVASWSSSADRYMGSQVVTHIKCHQCTSASCELVPQIRQEV